MESESESVAAIERLMADQMSAWNDGDIEGFMAGYQRGEELRFVSGGEVRQGWQTTLERYLRTYPDRAAMGRLMFAELDVRILSPGHAMVTGTWRLLREADEPNGRFTLLFKRPLASAERSGEWAGWHIVYDHTSSADEQ